MLVRGPPHPIRTFQRVRGRPRVGRLLPTARLRSLQAKSPALLNISPPDKVLSEARFRPWDFTHAAHVIGWLCWRLRRRPRCGSAGCALWRALSSLHRSTRAASLRWVTGRFSSGATVHLAANPPALMPLSRSRFTTEPTRIPRRRTSAAWGRGGQASGGPSAGPLGPKDERSREEWEGGKGVDSA